MKQFLDFEEIPKNPFEDLRVKILLEAIEKKEIDICLSKQKFIDYCENISKTINAKFIIEYEFDCDDIFVLKIYRNFIV